MKNSDFKRMHIVVVGGGFAGLNFVQQISASPAYRVTLIDKNNYNYFTPLLYQVATGFLEPSSISYPFRKLLGKTVSFRNATVVAVDPDAQKVVLENGDAVTYDYLVLAAGSETNFYNNENVSQRAFSLKGIDDAITMRNQLITNLERASHERDESERKKLLTLVIAGGGPTGVELAGMFAEMRKNILLKEYPELGRDEISIHVIDGAPYLLAPMSDQSHQEAFDVLTRLGVHVQLNTHVVDYKLGRVYLSDGQTIDTKMLIWSAGVKALKFDGIGEESYDRTGRLITDGTNAVKGHANIYAIGDVSIQFTDARYPKGHPQLAQPAIQQGKTLARNFKAMARGRVVKTFRYFDRGDMAIIGRNVAMADLFNHRLHLGGLPGLLSWLFIHLISLVNYTNKVKTLFNWAIAYITRDQSLRMVFGGTERKEGLKELPKTDSRAA